MKAVLEAAERALRGPRVSGLLEKFGVDPRRYWLLMDLFDQLSERGEMLDQLGRNGVALAGMAWMYAIFSGLFSLLFVSAQPALATYWSTFLAITAFLLVSVLLSEAGNSLMNPVEGVVLAHQPVNGATYTAAKLTHLVRIVLWLAPAINAIPACGGLFLKDAGWSYPLIHLLSAFGVGMVAALFCCALYGWLMRFVPARRLKAAGQLASSLPFLAMMWQRPIREWLAQSGVLDWWPVETAARWAFGLALAAAALAVVALGIRSLSADYLIRVSSLVRGGSAAGGRTRRWSMGETVARLFGGQAGRAGFVFVSRMARRDFQFRRQVAPLLVAGLAGLLPVAAGGWRTDPFSGQFTMMHLAPHLCGGLLLLLCDLLPYGSDFKGAWIFLLAPAEAFAPFARGVYAALWIQVILTPHLILLLFLAWAWGVWQSGLFVAFSAAVSSLYLALDLRRIDGAPFSKQVDPARSATLLPLLLAGGLAAAVAVALQHYVVFRSPRTVVMATAAAAAAAYVLTRNSLSALEAAIRYQLALLSAESGSVYREVGV